MERCHICLNAIEEGDGWREVKQFFRSPDGICDYFLVAVHEGCMHGRNCLVDLELSAGYGDSQERPKLYAGPSEPEER